MLSVGEPVPGQGFKSVWALMRQDKARQPEAHFNKKINGIDGIGSNDRPRRGSVMRFDEMIRIGKGGQSKEKYTI